MPATHFFSPESLRKLAQNNVTPENYLSWATQRFKQRTFFSSLIISSVITTILFLASFAKWQKIGAPLWTLLAMLAVMLVFASFLFVLSASLKSRLPTSSSSNRPSPKNFVAIDKQHVTSDKFINNISPMQWQKIIDFKPPVLATHDTSINRKKIKRFESHNKRCTILGHLGLIVLIPMLIVIVFLGSDLLTPWQRYPLMTILFLASTCVVIGYCGKLFFASLIGITKREITLTSAYGPTTYYGPIAILFGYWGIFLAIGFVGLYGLVVFFLEMGSQ